MHVTRKDPPTLIHLKGVDDLAGRHRAISRITPEQAKRDHLGKVRGQIDFSRSEQEILSAIDAVLDRIQGETDDVSETRRPADPPQEGSARPRLGGDDRLDDPCAASRGDPGPALAPARAHGGGRGGLAPRDGEIIRSWAIPPVRVYYRREDDRLIVLRIYDQRRRPIVPPPKASSSRRRRGRT
jgi:hypothetical protein